MPIHKPGLIALLMSIEEVDNYTFYLGRRNLGKFDRETTLRQVPIEYLVLANGDVCATNNFITPRNDLHKGINDRNGKVLSYHLRTAFFSNGCIDLNVESEDVVIRPKKLCVCSS